MCHFPLLLPLLTCVFLKASSSKQQQILSWNTDVLFGYFRFMPKLFTAALNSEGRWTTRRFVRQEERLLLTVCGCVPLLVGVSSEMLVHGKGAIKQAVLDVRLTFFQEVVFVKYMKIAGKPTTVYQNLFAAIAECCGRFSDKLSQPVQQFDSL